MQYVSNLKKLDLHNKRVVLRADLNIPTRDSDILNDFRLQSLRPTIDYIIAHGGKIVLLTHIGRPKQPTLSLSTRILQPWFSKHGYSTDFAQDIEQAYSKSLEHNSSIVLLENLRFFAGEKNSDPAFATKLATLGDIYINDAFGVMHRQDTSITLLAQQFAPQNRSIGLLVEHELVILNKLLHNPKKPFVLVLGGGKVADKLLLLESILDKVTTILLCPAIVFSFLKSQGKEVGLSLVDPGSFDLCKKLVQHAQHKGVEIVFPVDYQVTDRNIDGALSIVAAEQFPPNSIGVSIGPKTIEHFGGIINNAHTIFFNAAMGFPHRSETMQGTSALLQTIEKSHALSVIGGGDSVAAAQNLVMSKPYLSTGGGATLTYLSNKPLPGLVALNT